MKKVRDSRFELLRIISMFFVVFCHYSLNWKNSDSNFTTLFGTPFGQIGVDLFIMISGYFLSAEKYGGRLASRIVKVWSQTIFYAWLILIIDVFIRFQKITLILLLKSHFPVVTNHYWFVTSFLFMMAISPLLNEMIRRLNKKHLVIYLLLFIFGASMLTLISNNYSPFGASMGLGIMVTCYLFAGIVRKYKVTCGNTILIIMCVLGLLGEYFPMFFIKSDPLLLIGGFFPLIVAMAIFIFFTKVKSFYSKTVNWFAKSVFASYLIVCNGLFQNVLWKYLNVHMFTLHPIIPGIIISALIVLSISIVDKLYLYLDKHVFVNITQKLISKLTNAIQ